MLKKQFLFLSALFALNLSAHNEPVSKDDDQTNEEQSNEEIQAESSNSFTFSDIAKIVGVFAGAAVSLKIADEFGLVTKEKAKRNKILAILKANSPVLNIDNKWCCQAKGLLFTLANKAEFQAALDTLAPSAQKNPTKQLKIARKIVATKLAQDKNYKIENLKHCANVQHVTTLIINEITQAK